MKKKRCFKNDSRERTRIFCLDKTKKQIKKNKAKKKRLKKLERKAKSLLFSKRLTSLKDIHEKNENEDLEHLFSSPSWDNFFNFNSAPECANTSMDENNYHSNVEDLNSENNSENLNEDSKSSSNLNESNDDKVEASTGNDFGSGNASCSDGSLSNTSASLKENRSFLEETSFDFDHENCMLVFPSHRRLLVILNHPTTLTIKDFVHVKVITGKISIFGWEMDEKSKSIDVYSTLESGAFQLKTVCANKMWTKGRHFSKVKRVLRNLLPKDKANEIILKCHSFPILVLFELNKFHAKQKFIQQYMPNIFDNVRTYEYPDQDEMKTVPGYDVLAETNEKNGISITHQFQEVAQIVSSEISFARTKGFPCPRVLVYGSQHCGKSTFLRYLVNHVLLTNYKVYYLDTDLEQSEFTPAGCISLTEVTKPLFGPAFTHLKEPLKSVFMGLVAVDSYPSVYIKYIKDVMTFYDNNCNDEILFINTMGYTTDIEAICLNRLINCVKPTILIQLVSNGREPDKEVAEKMLYKNFKHIYVQAPSTSTSLLTSPVDLRDLRLIAYMGQCLELFEKVKTLNGLKSYCVPYNKLAIQDFPYHFTPDKLVESLSPSVVALCIVDNSIIIKSNDPLFPHKLPSFPKHTCLGFGIVRAVNFQKQLLYIVTPLAYDKLKTVNALLKGNITVPKQFFLKQAIQGVKLPFTRLVFLRVLNKLELFH